MILHEVPLKMNVVQALSVSATNASQHSFADFLPVMSFGAILLLVAEEENIMFVVDTHTSVDPNWKVVWYIG